MKLDNLLCALDIKSDARKKALLLHYGGDDIFEIYDSMTDEQKGIGAMTQGDNPTTTEYEALKTHSQTISSVNRTQPVKLLSFVKLNNMMVNPLTASTHASQILLHCVIFTTRTKRS